MEINKLPPILLILLYNKNSELRNILFVSPIFLAIEFVLLLVFM